MDSSMEQEGFELSVALAKELVLAEDKCRRGTCRHLADRQQLVSVFGGSRGIPRRLLDGYRRAW
jgi:hypothetical protein